MLYKCYAYILVIILGLQVIFCNVAFAQTHGGEDHVKDTTKLAKAVTAWSPVHNDVFNIDTNWLAYKKIIDTSVTHNTLYLLDYSNSMVEEDKLKALQSSVMYTTTLLKTTDNYSVIAFSDSAELIMKNSINLNYKNVAAALQTFKKHGGTDINSALLRAYEFLVKENERRAINKIVLITDGEFTINEHVAKKVEAYAKNNNIRLSIILVNYFDEKTKKYIQKICKAGNGNFYELRQENLIPSLVKEAAE
jgi:uncharacterized protein with von Willebrand factor type A (vWA) domain